jgi:hypothetical protein
MRMNKNFKKAQVVLFVIVILTIVVIIVSSIVDRSLTGQRNTGINTDSSRAFNAAEAGIDELLSRTDLSSLQTGQPYPIRSVDPNFFVQDATNYTITSIHPGYFGVIPQNSLLQVEFNSTPTALKIYFEPTSCVEVSMYSYDSASPTVYYVKRSFICEENVVGDKINNSELMTDPCPLSSFNTARCYLLTFESGQIAKMLTVRVLKADSQIELTTTDANYGSFATKALTADSSALTKSGVKKEIQVETKTTKDIYSVFDHVLYIR